jgi:Fe-S-cluster containining protein
VGINDKELLFREFRMGTFGGKLSSEDGVAFERAMFAFRAMLGQPERGADYVRAVYRLVDELLAEYTTMNPMTCHKGCGACCHQLVCCSKLEMELITEYLRKLFRRASREIRLNAKKQAIKFDKLAKQAGVKQESDGERLRQLHQGIACPYLSNSQRCLIYPARPIDCRIARTRGVCYPGVSGHGEPREGPKPVKLFLDQVACNLITEEDIRVSGSILLIPLVTWPITPQFSANFP